MTSPDYQKYCESGGPELEEGTTMTVPHLPEDENSVTDIVEVPLQVPPHVVDVAVANNTQCYTATGEPEFKTVTGEPEFKTVTGEPEFKTVTGEAEVNVEGSSQVEGGSNIGGDSNVGGGSQDGSTLIGSGQNTDFFCKLNNLNSELRKVAVKIPSTKEKLKAVLPKDVPPRAELHFSYRDGSWKCIATWGEDDIKKQNKDITVGTDTEGTEVDSEKNNYKQVEKQVEIRTLSAEKASRNQLSKQFSKQGEGNNKPCKQQTKVSPTSSEDQAERQRSFAEQSLDEFTTALVNGDLQTLKSPQVEPYRESYHKSDTDLQVKESDADSQALLFGESGVPTTNAKLGPVLRPVGAPGDNTNGAPGAAPTNENPTYTITKEEFMKQLPVYSPQFGLPLHVNTTIPPGVAQNIVAQTTPVVTKMTSIPNSVNKMSSIPNSVNKMSSIPNSVNKMSSIPNSVQKIQPDGKLKMSPTISPVVQPLIQSLNQQPMRQQQDSSQAMIGLTDQPLVGQDQPLLVPGILNSRSVSKDGSTSKNGSMSDGKSLKFTPRCRKASFVIEPPISEFESKLLEERNKTLTKNAIAVINRTGKSLTPIKAPLLCCAQSMTPRGGGVRVPTPTSRITSKGIVSGITPVKLLVQPTVAQAESEKNGIANPNTTPPPIVANLIARLPSPAAARLVPSSVQNTPSPGMNKPNLEVGKIVKSQRPLMPQTAQVIAQMQQQAESQSPDSPTMQQQSKDITVNNVQTVVADGKSPLFKKKAKPLMPVKLEDGSETRFPKGLDVPQMVVSQVQAKVVTLPQNYTVDSKVPPSIPNGKMIRIPNNSVEAPLNVPTLLNGRLPTLQNMMPTKFGGTTGRGGTNTSKPPEREQQTIVARGAPIVGSSIQTNATIHDHLGQQNAAAEPIVYEPSLLVVGEHDEKQPSPVSSEQVLVSTSSSQRKFSSGISSHGRNSSLQSRIDNGNGFNSGTAEERHERVQEKVRASLKYLQSQKETREFHVKTSLHHHMLEKQKEEEEKLRPHKVLIERMGSKELKNTMVDMQCRVMNAYSKFQTDFETKQKDRISKLGEKLYNESTKITGYGQETEYRSKQVSPEQPSITTEPTTVLLHPPISSMPSLQSHPTMDLHGSMMNHHHGSIMVEDKATSITTAPANIQAASNVIPVVELSRAADNTGENTSSTSAEEKNQELIDKKIQGNDLCFVPAAPPSSIPKVQAFAVFESGTSNSIIVNSRRPSGEWPEIENRLSVSGKNCTQKIQRQGTAVLNELSDSVKQLNLKDYFGSLSKMSRPMLGSVNTVNTALSNSSMFAEHMFAEQLKEPLKEQLTTEELNFKLQNKPQLGFGTRK